MRISKVTKLSTESFVTFDNFFCCIADAQGVGILFLASNSYAQYSMGLCHLVCHAYLHSQMDILRKRNHKCDHWHQNKC